MAHVLHQSIPTFVAAFRADNLPFSSVTLSPVASYVFPAVLFFSVVSCVVFFSSALDSTSSLSSVAGALRLLPFLCVTVSSFTAVSTTPGLCSAHLAWSMEAPIMASHVFLLLFFTQQKFGPSRASGVYVWTKSHTHSGRS